MMKKGFFLGFFMLLSTLWGQAQNISIEADLAAGQIYNSYIVENRFVFELTSDGRINAIYAFRDPGSAHNFIADPLYAPRPNNQVNAGNMMVFTGPTRNIQ